MASKRVRECWTSAREGTLTPWSLVKVWALHTVSKERSLHLEHTEIDKLVKEVGTHGKRGGRPTPMAIQKLRAQFDEDPDWYPGKGLETGPVSYTHLRAHET